MKKFIALVLAILMVGTFASYANDTEAIETNEEIVAQPAETPEAYQDKMVIRAAVKSVSESQIETDELVLNIDENTLVVNTELIPTEVKEGNIVTAVVSTATTRSIPPQSYAYYVIVSETIETPAPMYMTVSEVKDGYIYSDDGKYEVTYENTPVEMYRTKNIVKAEELTKGSEIFVYADVMTMSIPALVNPTKIVIMSVAEPTQEDDEEIIEEPTEDRRTVEGIVKSISENQIELDDIVLNFDENTLVVGADLIPTEVKEGSHITAIVSTAATFSLPPQSYAYYIITREDAVTSVPLYITVSKVKDGYIYSADGKYEITCENTPIEMYKTKNIVKAEELTEGSVIFVYADVMTMSIPALVNPTKIVIMSIADVSETTVADFSKADALYKKEILVGTDNGLELDRNVTRAEAVTLIQRTTASDKMAYRSSFDDVPETHWAYAHISWASEKKIVEGVGDNKFEPDRFVNAKELAKMILNAMGEEVEFEGAFAKALETGIVTPEDEIEENDILTRDAASKMIYNYISK